jgi:ribonucleoside-diphosphate reductase alpha chain
MAAALTPYGLDLLTKRYLIKDQNGTPTETVDEMFRRVAKHVAKDDADAQAAQDKFEATMKALLFLPNTPTFTGSGTRLGQLAACFVLPIDDDLGHDPSDSGIFTTLHVAALVQQSGGGVGCSWSRLRESGSAVTSCNGTSSGPIPFMRAYSEAFHAISQGGSRRGANMAVLRVDHPDIASFVRCKATEKDLSNFNLSVALTDKFISDTLVPGALHRLISPHTREVVATVDARELIDSILEHAVFNGEPGVIFVDEINRKNPCPHLYTIEATNPCVTGDTMILTTEGLRQARDLFNTPFDAVIVAKSGQHYKSDGFFCTGRKPVVTLTLVGGRTLKLTGDHRVMTDQRTWVPAGELEYTDSVLIDDGTAERVFGVEFYGVDDVYDCNVETAHAFSANGMIVHNCGEQALGPYESCCLGSVNLARHVVFPDENSLFGYVDWELLATTVRTAVRFLDDVITANRLPHPKLKEASLATRRIGLGFMGLADLLYATGMRYGSALGIDVTTQVAEFIQYHAMSTSVDLARERGPFPAIKGSCYDPERFTWKPPKIEEYTMNTHKPPLDWLALTDRIRTVGIRNAALTTVAPTGTIATVAGVEGYGIEPVFSLSYVRYVLNQNTGARVPFRYFSGLFSRAMRILKIDDESPQVFAVKRTGSCQHLVGMIPPVLTDIFVTAGDLSIEEHVRMQAAVQRVFCNSISKTINMPPSASVDDAREAVYMAWRLGCRGLTLYRERSRETEVLVSGAK